MRAFPFFHSLPLPLLQNFHFIDFAFHNLFGNLARHLASLTRLTDLKLFDLRYDAEFALEMPSKKEKPMSTVTRLTLEVDFGNEDSWDDEEDSSDDDGDSPDDQHGTLDCQDSSEDDADSPMGSQDSLDDEEDSDDDYEHFFKCIAAWFPALIQLTLITDEESFAGILQACQEERSFSVKLVDGRHFDSIHSDL